MSSRCAEPIAIVGQSARYPGAADLKQYWENLAQGKNSIREISPARWDVARYFDPRPGQPGKTYSKWLGSLEDIDCFDAPFFNISPAEAQMMDPQHRLFLQEAYRAFEDAGFDRHALNNRKCGVYLGIMHNEYGLILQKALGDLATSVLTSSSFSIAAARIAYYLNLKGPAISVDTACSSSLVALHLARQALLNGEVDMALVGGVTLYLMAESYVGMCNAGMLSPDGQCKPFDDAADGIVPGEGVGALVLKRLSDAEAAEDVIHGLIVGSALNQDGKTNGITAPSLASQIQLIRDLYAQHQIDPRELSYVEMHGTGTKIGDPIELRALASAFGDCAQRKNYCAIGSVKSNIGHTSAAAGIAGVHKVLLSLRHGQLPPSLNFSTPNKYFDFQDSPFFVNTELRAWETPADRPRLAAVSSFGMSGTNAHLVIEEYVPATRGAQTAIDQVCIVLSAQNETRLREQVTQLLRAVQEGDIGDKDLADVAYTLQVGREALEVRVACVATSIEQLKTRLERHLNGDKRIEGLYRGDTKSNKELLALFASNTELQGAVDAWIRAGKLGELLSVWVKGLSFDWQRLHGENKPRRISLPGYPFAKDRHWVQAVAQSAPVESEWVEETVEVLSASSEIVSTRRPELRGMSVEQCVGWELKRIASEVLKLPREQLESDRNLADFGFDSIGVRDFARQLSQHYGFELTPSVFFSHPTLAKLTEHLVSEQLETLRAFYQEEQVTAKPVRSVKRRRVVASASAPSASSVEPIAIIGMSGRFPQARDVDELWRILAEGRDAVEEIPAERFDWRSVYGEEPGKTHCKWGGYIPGVAEFDPLFFEISPREAELMDPRQRLLLQEAWKALEDAGYGSVHLNRQKIGMFVGVEQGDYQLLTGVSASITGNHDAILASRLAYFLNLRGPTMAINTACSSGLVAAHQACLSLRAGECDTAIAAGVNLMLTPQGYIGMSQAGMLSPQGRCFAFDQRADGMVPAEAVAVVVLKRLSRAQADGDPIYAVIRGSGLNYDGKTNGITAPSGASQASLLKEVYEHCGVQPQQLEYIVTHGTGTRLGDPIEINALTEVFKESTSEQGFCALTSTKSNFGHTLAASGLVSLIGLVQSIRHRSIPASLHCEQQNDYIEWQASPFYINKETRAWPMRAESCLGAVSAFGMSGTNAHMVVSGYEAPATEIQSPPCFLLVLSAKSEVALQEKVSDLLGILEQDSWDRAALLKMSTTLLIGRQHFAHRCAVVVQDRDDALYAWRQLGKEKLPNAFHSIVQRDFAPQTVLHEQAQELVGRCASLQGDSRKYRQTLGALAELYCQGYELSWERMHEAVPRVHLPTYPFARQDYWVPANEIMSAVPAVAATPANDAYELMTFEEAWQPESLLEPVAVRPKKLLCFLSQPESQQAVIEAVKKSNPQAAVVFISQQPAVGHYSVACRERGDYVDALSAASKEHGAFDAMLYLWPLEDREKIQALDPLVYILQAAAQAKIDCPRLLLAGEFGDDLQRSHLESWIGFERSLSLVLPQLRLSVVMRDQAATMQEWLGVLWREIQSPRAESALYIAGSRCVRRVHRTSLQAANPPLRKGGVYLITGGAGALGLLLAEHLAKNYAAKLILTGRGALDEARKNKLRTFGKWGGEALYLQVDVCDAAGLSAALQQAEQNFGALHGIIHAAGIENRESILQKDIGAFRQVVAPKIAGTLVLEEVARDRQLDFICYFSSSSAVLGDFGVCDYAVGNRFQWARAQYDRHSRCRRVLAINWPLWRDGGMGWDADGGMEMYLKSSGQRALAAQEAMALFEQLLAHDVSHQLVLVGKPSRVYGFLGLDENEEEEIVTASSELVSTRRPELRGMSVEQCVGWELKRIASEVLKLPREQLESDRNLADFGFDSIGVRDFARQLSQHYGFELTPSVFFSHPTLAKLTEHLVSEQLEILRAFYQEEQVTAKPVRSVKRRRVVSSAPTTSISSVEPIAIIGMSGRFPQARDVDELWRILAEGRDAVEEIPAERFDWRSVYGEEPGKTHCKWGGYIPGVAEFDPLFFEISPREAELMDPRQRLLLQEAWKALEDAGYGSVHLNRQKIGMFVGVEQGDYQLLTGVGASITGNHDAILASRLAYFLNLRGPTMAINTACSSGLVAAHQACLSLRAGECDTAIAAGVNLMLTPQGYIGMSQAGMLSPQGRCFAFDQRADGMVPAEAVAVVVLKRLSRAQADGDPIYAVIRGSGLNYDGKTNGITAPSGASQASLLKEVYEHCGVQPQQLEYIVTHGTGTRLGDPIEINALTEVFKESTSEQGFCALTSTKSNFGHALAASGLVSLIGLVQSIRHRSIPASLHCEQQNDYIEWQASPFYINKETRAWPMRAESCLGAVSAFGMSGTNAHMVVSGYEAPATEIQAPPCFLLVLSAKSEAALQEKVSDLLGVLEQDSWDRAALLKMSTTLLIGRQHFAHRCAVVVQDRDDALYAWRQLGKEKLPNAFHCIVPRDFTPQTLLHEHAEGLVTQCAGLLDDPAKYRQTLCALAELYCQGYPLSWERLYGESNRIHLPAYPFARDRYWVRQPVATVTAAVNQLHPLLHSNTSSFSAQRFSSTFTGDEFFLKDHIVQGARMLPGVAYLEMAREAVARSSAGLIDNARISLKDIVWSHPLRVAEAPVTVHVALHPQSDSEIQFEIYSGEGSETVYVRGCAVLTAVDSAPTVDFRSLQARCENSLTALQCYDVFDALGIEYGPAFRAINNISKGTGGTFVLAQLELPESLHGTQTQFQLHPSLLDSALQSCIALSAAEADAKAVRQAALPFALTQLDVFDVCPSSTMVYVREAADSNSQLRKFDLDLCDEAGQVCVQVRGFCVRSLGSTEVQEPVDSAALTTFIPLWDALATESAALSPALNENLLLVGEDETQLEAFQALYPRSSTMKCTEAGAVESLVRLLEERGPFDHIFWLAPKNPAAALLSEDCIERQQLGVLGCFRLVKALLQLDYGVRELGFTAITIQSQAVNREESIDPTHASLHGLMGSMAKEYPHWKVRVVDVEDSVHWPMQELLKLPPDPHGNAWAYRNKQWYRQRLLPGELAAAGKSSYRQGGVYVLIGGAGGIGVALSEYLIRNYRANIIWIGRRAVDVRMTAEIDRLSKLGPAPRYLVADASDRQALEQAYRQIKAEFHEIHGVVHTAIALLDKSLLYMEEQRFKDGLAAKIDVSVRLAQVFGREPLDFVLFLSSMQSFSKAAGQSNYAAGCAFKDAFAHQLGRQLHCAVKVMSWGYWGSVGSVAAEDYRQRMLRMGIGSIEPDEGTAALEMLLAGPLTQMGLLKATSASPLKQLGLDSQEYAKVYAASMQPAAESLAGFVAAEFPADEAVAANSAVADFEGLLAKLLLVQLQSLGLCGAVSAKTEFGVPQLYERWLQESIAVLTERELVSAPVGATAWQEWEQRKASWLGDPNFASQVALAEVALRALPEILLGKRSATEVLFADGSTQLVDGVYKNNRFADYFNEALAAAVAAYVDERRQLDPHARIRIIEIGAGTGSATTHVLRRLASVQDSIAEYCYTDVSKAFLHHAEAEYGPHAPYLSYKLLDIEQSPQSQSIEAGGYDLAIASNVLHATKNIRRTLNNAKSTLKQGGWLLLNEIADRSLFTHLTFGLLRGWWLYEDAQLRIPGSPGLYPESWRRALEDSGFSAVRFPAASARAFKQQIVIAKSDGVVRARKALPDTPHKVVEPLPIQRSAESASRANTTAEGYVRQTIIDQLAAGLRIDARQLDARKPFVEYGLDSIIGVQLSKTLNQALQIELNSTTLFEHTTVEALTAYISTRYRDLNVPQPTEQPREVSAEPAKPAAVGLPIQRLRKTQRFSAPRPQRAAHEVSDDIAIIGFSGRFPQARSPEAFWEALKSGRDLVTEIPEERWPLTDFFLPDAERASAEGRSYSKWGGFIEHARQIDHEFFEDDPQLPFNLHQRHLLEVAWNALEAAGYTPSSLQELYRGRVGVYAGAISGGTSLAIGTLPSGVAKVFNCNGPCIGIDAMSTSALAAVQMACDALRRGDCEIAIAGSVNLLTPGKYLLHSMMRSLGTDAHTRCYSGSDGMVIAECAGALVLKPLQKAIEAGDRIDAVIKSSLAAHVGGVKGRSLPNIDVLVEAFTDNFNKTHIDPRSIGYVETTACGLRMADRLEIAMLSKVFARFTQDRNFCRLGTAKSNMGHAEGASAMAQIIKVLLQLRHRKFVPLIKLEQVDPDLPLHDTPFSLQRQYEDWQRPVISVGGEQVEYPRRAMVNSLGAGGSLASIIIEEYIGDSPPVSRANGIAKPQLIVLSARNPERLQVIVRRLAKFIAAEKEVSLSDLAYTLQVGREAMASRLAVIASDKNELLRALRSYPEGSASMFAGEVQGDLPQESAIAEAAERCWADQDLKRLAALWVDGAQLPWCALRGNEGRRIELPTYPFEETARPGWDVTY